MLILFFTKPQYNIVLIHYCIVQILVVILHNSRLHISQYQLHKAPVLLTFLLSEDAIALYVYCIEPYIYCSVFIYALEWLQNGQQVILIHVLLSAYKNIITVLSDDLP